MLDANVPSSASFEATVVTPNEITSPLTGQRAAALRVTLLVRRMPLGQRSGNAEMVGVDLGGGGGPNVFTRVGDVWYGSSIVLADGEGREVVVSTAGLSLRGGTIDPGATPLGPDVPPELERLVAAAAQGLVSYRESLLLHGARVRLRGTVLPIGPGRWETRPDSGPMILQALAPPPRPKARIS